ncbi:MAG TPA: S9 family peptidase [Candidatus Rubrimentiphilum sp.]|nr:S9 family peptidase [Candidatus Rubrimentiphilum sp.]
MMLIAITTPPAQTLTLKLADLRKTVSLGSPAITPDGRNVALILRRGDYKKDRSVADVVLVNVRTRATRTLLHDVTGLGQIAWSPDGSRLAYVAQGVVDPDDPNSDHVSQIFVLPMNGGEATQVTHDTTGVNAFDWRPDGRALAYSARIEAPNAKAIKAHDDAFDVTDDAWTDQSAPTPEYLYEIASSGGKAKRVGAGDWSVGGGFTYAHDGRSVFVTRITGHRHPNRYLSRQIVRLNVASGGMTALPQLSTTQSDPVRASSGRIAFAFSNPRGTMQTEIALADANGANPRSITTGLDRNVGDASFLPDGSLLLTANDATQRRLFRVTPAGAVSVVPIGTLSTSVATVSRNGIIAFTGVAPNRPTELYLVAPGAKTPVRLTNYNGWISRYRLGVTRPVTWRTFDGMTADGVLTAPPSFDKLRMTRGGRAPLVLYIHGGPTAASTTAYSGFVQVMAAHGWFVFQPNYRGSDNLGLKYARTTVPHITSVPGRDIEAGLATVLATTPIDSSRIGVSGWSEGGLMTSWLITQDHRWRAAVSGAAVNDWVQYDTMTDAKDFAPQFIGKSPWSSSSEYNLYEAESPLSYASNVRTPTLIMSDAGDFRVPTPLAYEFYHEVRATGTPVQFLIYPVVGHFPRDPVRIEDIYRNWEAWFVKYLGS